MQLPNKIKYLALSLTVTPVLLATAQLFYLGLHGIDSNNYKSRYNSDGGISITMESINWKLFRGESRFYEIISDDDGDGDADIYFDSRSMRRKDELWKDVFYISPEGRVAGVTGIEKTAGDVFWVKYGDIGPVERYRREEFDTNSVKSGRVVLVMTDPEQRLFTERLENMVNALSVIR